jgi:hypothetical protein
VIAVASAAALASALVAPLTDSAATHRTAAQPGGVPVSTPLLKVSAASGLAGLLSLSTQEQVHFNGVLGSGNPAFHVRTGSSAPHVSSPTAGLEATFGADGPIVTFGAESVGLSLASVEFGAVSTAITPAMPTHTGNAVTYRRGGITETYTNGPLGLAQSFTIAERPDGADAGPLTLSMQLTSGTSADVANEGTSATFVRDGRSIGAYRGLAVSDANHATVPAYLTGVGSALQIRVNDQHARYPLTIDPFIYNSYGEGPDGFGYAVAHASDGWAAVGSPYEDNSRGTVYVANSGIPDGSDLQIRGQSAGDQFGFSVAVAAGGWVVVGAPFKDIGAVWDAGMVYRYTCQYVCTRGATMIAADAQPLDNLGVSVDISYVSGSWVIVGGSPNDDYGSVDDTGSGRVWVNSWGDNVPHEASLVPASPGFFSNAWAGSAVAISDASGGTCNGHVCRTIVLGAPGTHSQAGSTFIYEEPPTGWENATAAIEPSRTMTVTGPGAFLGYRVDISSNGTVVVSGAPLDEVGTDTDQGSVRVFTRDGTSWYWTWPKKATLTDDTGDAFDQLGQDVRISDNGARIVAGSPYSETILGQGQIPGEGQVLMYNKPGSGWANSGSPAERISSGSGEAAEDHFGEAVDILDNGKVIVGAPDNTNQYGNRGMVEGHVLQ